MGLIQFTTDFQRHQPRSPTTPHVFLRVLSSSSSFTAGSNPPYSLSFLPSFLPSSLIPTRLTLHSGSLCARVARCKYWFDDRNLAALICPNGGLSTDHRSQFAGSLYCPRLALSYKEPQGAVRDRRHCARLLCYVFNVCLFWFLKSMLCIISS